MNFVGSYNCWNEFLKEDNTQVFVFTERAHDAKAIVVAWRGTEPFNAMDWSTDFDFSWYNFKNMGNVHVASWKRLVSPIATTKNRSEGFGTNAEPSIPTKW